MDPAVVGAFLSGVGAVLGAGFSIRSARKRAEQECEKQLQALREGFRLARE
jgi:hypothetical protein